jgi:hypothetical protein
MATYLLAINAVDLSDYANQVNSEEAGGSQFQDSSVSYHQSQVTNIVTFLELPPGTRPTARFQILNKGDPAPTNTRPIWAGFVIISAGVRPASAYR